MSTSQQAYVERTLKTAGTFLERWNLADAVMWELTASHKTLRVLLTREGNEGNLLISCLDPSRLHGPIRWRNSNLVISMRGKDFLVVDEPGGVEIVCGGLEIKENVKLY